MNKLVECPNCLGTGEEVIRQKYTRPCRFCKGEGMLDEEISESLIDERFYEDL